MEGIYCSTFEVFFKLLNSSGSIIDGGGADSNPDSTNASLDFQRKKRYYDMKIWNILRFVDIYKENV